MPTNKNNPAYTAVAHPNIALIKYWGKRDVNRNLPVTGSVSITLDELRTRTTVIRDCELESDEFIFQGVRDDEGLARLVPSLERLRRVAGSTYFARVESDNNFPTAAGLASSASGFAALITAGCAAYGIEADDRQRSAWARMGSGSAARSIFGGFVRLRRGYLEDGSDATAEPLMSADDWPLKVVIAITDTSKKAHGSTEGMQRSAETSPYFSAWEQHNEASIPDAVTAIQMRDFEALADVSEASCLRMHAVMQATWPPLIYWNGATVDAIRRVRDLRARQGVPVFFTVDAGPQVKAVCLPEAAARVEQELAAIHGVDEVLVTGLGEGARLESS